MMPLKRKKSVKPQKTLLVFGVILGFCGSRALQFAARLGVRPVASRSKLRSGAKWKKSLTVSTGSSDGEYVIGVPV